MADSYDIYNFVSVFMEEYKDKILARDGVFVVRPDSITPLHDTPASQVLWICQELHRIFGATQNKLGYYEINPKVKVLWGDGIDIADIDNILSTLKEHKYAASNIATFGMGGGLLQKVNRDTLRCAFKCSNRVTKGGSTGLVSAPVMKNPLDTSKKSKGGKFKVTEENGVWKCENALLSSGKLRLVYQNGILYNNMQFSDVRENAKM